MWGKFTKKLEETGEHMKKKIRNSDVYHALENIYDPITYYNKFIEDANPYYPELDSRVRSAVSEIEYEKVRNNHVRFIRKDFDYDKGVEIMIEMFLQKFPNLSAGSTTKIMSRVAYPSQVLSKTAAAPRKYRSRSNKRKRKSVRRRRRR
jgi:hypothetical protein